MSSDNQSPFSIHSLCAVSSCSSLTQSDDVHPLVPGSCFFVKSIYSTERESTKQYYYKSSKLKGITIWFIGFTFPKSVVFLISPFHILAAARDISCFCFFEGGERGERLSAV